MKPLNEHSRNGRLDIFQVWSLTDGEDISDALPFRALDAEDASIEWARHHDEHTEDYIARQMDEPCVEVQSPDGTLSRWRVQGEYEPVYSAESL